MAGSGQRVAGGSGAVAEHRFVLLVGEADGCPYALPGVSESPDFRVPVLKGRWAERMIAEGSILWRRLRVVSGGLELDQEA
eukprot:9091674-Alexandrium_andersonii.AAC.1